MEAIFFFYNIIITLAYVFCCVSFFALYRKSRDRRLKCLAMVFLLFVLDNLQFFMNEFLPGFSNFYTTMTERAPILRVVCSFLICLSYRRVFLAYAGRRSSKLEITAWICAAAAIIVSMAFYNTVLGMILDFLVINVVALVIFALALHSIGGNGPLTGGQGAPDISTGLVRAGLIMEALCVLEQILDMYGVRVIPPRYVSIEILGAVYAIAAAVFIFREFGRLMSGETAETSDASGLKPGKELDLTGFGKAYKLTGREQDILEYLIRGLSVAQICEEAHIAQGTVKTHTHNIYQKVEVKNRIQLLTRITEFRYEKQ